MSQGGDQSLVLHFIIGQMRVEPRATVARLYFIEKMSIQNTMRLTGLTYQEVKAHINEVEELWTDFLDDKLCRHSQSKLNLNSDHPLSKKQSHYNQMRVSMKKTDSL